MESSTVSTTSNHTSQPSTSHNRATTIADITEEVAYSHEEEGEPEPEPEPEPEREREREREREQEQEQEEQTGPSVESETPLFVERKRHHFSYDANELRRRTAASNTDTTSSNGKQETKSSGTTRLPPSTSGGGDGFYECNICFDTATHPVLTLCGHLFCWSCLAQWLNAQSRNPTCPVCKAGCGKDKVIPVYGRGREQKDPRNDPSIPTRPAGQRPPPLRDPNRPGTTFFGQNIRNGYNSRNVTFSGGIGFFPFGISFNFPMNADGNGATDFQTQAQQNAFMSRLFLMILSLVIVAIIFS